MRRFLQITQIFTIYRLRHHEDYAEFDAAIDDRTPSKSGMEMKLPR